MVKITTLAINQPNKGVSRRVELVCLAEAYPCPPMPAAPLSGRSSLALPLISRFLGASSSTPRLDYWSSSEAGGVTLCGHECRAALQSPLQSDDLCGSEGCMCGGESVERSDV